MFMKKILKQNKGFSLIELLVAILIMAVIAGTAIMLFGGVLSSSRESADNETAENLKRAILTYMNMTNDTNLSCLGVTSSSSITASDLINKLSCRIKIEDDKVTFTVPANLTDKITQPTVQDPKIDGSDIRSEYGPFLDGSKNMNPQTPGKNGWKIVIDEKAQVVTVEASDSDENIEINAAESGG